MEKSLHHEIKKVAIALCGIAAILIAANFIIAGSPSFILYSFLFFVVLAFIISANDHSIRTAVIFAIALIVAGAIGYANISVLKLSGLGAPIFLFAFVIAAVVSIYAELGILRTAAISGSVLVAFLEYLAAPAESVLLSTNAAILGYYLLISSVIALLIASSSLSQWIERRIASISSGKNSIKAAYVLIVFVAILLVLPIWPSYVPIRASGLPYASFTIEPANGSQPTNYISINATRLSLYADYNLSNIALYINGMSVPAVVLGNANLQYENAIIYIEGAPPAVGEKMDIYFLPFDYSGVQTPQRVSESNFTPYRVTALHAKFASLTYHGSYTNVTRTYTESYRSNHSSSSKIVVYPPYFVNPVCPSGSNESLQLLIHTNVTSSLFLLSGESNFSRAVSESYSNYSYSSYLRSFGANSYAKYLNATSAYFNKTLDSCMYYAIVPEHPALVQIQTNESYYLNKSVTETLKAPSILSTSARGVLIRPNFLPFNIRYLQMELNPGKQ